MVRKIVGHTYADRASFERMMLLVATLLQYPGVGCADVMASPTDEHHNALEEVRSRLQQVARDCGVVIPDYAVATLRKDLETLRRYGILDRRMYRWGYYLGTGVMTRQELQVAINALASQAKYQGDSQTRLIYQALTKRLRGLDLELAGHFFYPVRSYLNRAINHTDPEEMMAKGQHRDTLFHQLEVVEQAIYQGQTIEISRGTNLYGTRLGVMQIVPLQLVYHDIAWYLIYECDNGLLAVGRVNRFKDYCKIITHVGRGLQAQQLSLDNAHKLLRNGWGLNLGDMEQQQLELQGRLSKETVKVRFFPPVSAFILEGELRHPQQKVIAGNVDETTGKPVYVDYIIKLPARSLDEFSFWVYRYMDKAVVLSPSALVEKHRQAAQALVTQYTNFSS